MIIKANYYTGTIIFYSKKKQCLISFEIIKSNLKLVIQINYISKQTIVILIWIKQKLQERNKIYELKNLLYQIKLKNKHIVVYLYQWKKEQCNLNIRVRACQAKSG